ncbi:penicillin acylase family protein [Shewanella sp. WPAGA9]|uniref:penicillin acylase family protein n=1 Tax=Shewanella sp. ENK2 TaxID=2775245 RepID=UPI001781215B|nr:penicillin acylase family protein [Shewanella sp. WPAGA9]
MSFSLNRVLQSKFTKYSLAIVLLLVGIIILAIYSTLRLSMPSLSATVVSDDISAPLTIERDTLGTAIITASNRKDAAYALGYAHSQDRFFQMDLLRRNAAGELAEIFGKAALKLDKNKRFHQLRMRAQNIFEQLPQQDKAMLSAYTQGVNHALAEQTVRSFEYLLTQSSPREWHETDSLLVIYSMYLDLQGNTIKRDMALTQLQQAFGNEMVDFLIQPSHHQAALDDSQIPLYQGDIPALEDDILLSAITQAIEEPVEVGSNNWAVTGQLTDSGRAMLSDDMHLSFAVPIIWYRAQLNYQTSAAQDSAKSNPPVSDKSSHQITGVSLPGAPAIVVGSNGKLAWGFTNSYIDTADWIEISPDTAIDIEYEPIELPNDQVNYTIQVSEFGPVKTVAGVNYALSWVGHADYAVNMALLSLETAETVEQASALATEIGIPAQNMLLADNQGNAGWTIAGAVPARDNPSNTAQSPSNFQSSKWQLQQAVMPEVINPDNQRIWTANSRVLSSEEQLRFGDGGYALGARGVQIRDRLLASSNFSEADFYQLQLDNEALFLAPWQQYLLQILSEYPVEYAEDIKLIANWGHCACADSVGYTLVRHFRTALIDQTFAPIETELKERESGLSVIKRYLETPMWQIIEQQPASWLPKAQPHWQAFALSAYNDAKQALFAKYSKHQKLSDLRWGKVNQLLIQHPFSKQIPQLSRWLDMPSVDGFGDSFMPAVQGKSFGASQRFIVQPGAEQDAIMTIPGGQSGHPLSPYYRSGYQQYVTHQNTPLLPTEIEHTLMIEPLKDNHGSLTETDITEAQSDTQNSEAVKSTAD